MLTIRIKILFQSEYDEDKVDPYQNQKEPQKPPEGMDLPDDLKLDDDLDKDEETEHQGSQFCHTDSTCFQ